MKKELPFYSAIILAFFTIIFLIKTNYEFLLYAAVLLAIIYIIAKTDKIFHYSSFAKWGFGTLLFLHLSGGAFYIKGTRLYDIILIPILGEPFNILKYDQIMHIFIYFVIALFVYAVVIHIVDKKANRIFIGVIAFLATIGLGALYEIIEFSTVVLFSSTGVGNYYNNALDLIFNAIGALIALVLISKDKRILM